jgi:hypothetical protein
MLVTIQRRRSSTRVGALLVLEELDVALPDQLLGRPPRLGGRGAVLQHATPRVDRLEPGEDGGVVGLRSQEGAEPGDRVLGGA